MTVKGSIAICFWCKHFNAKQHHKTGKTICSAFLENIPTEIWDLEYDHREPYEGDNGIQFQKLDNFDETEITFLTRLTEQQIEQVFRQHIHFLTGNRRLGLIKPHIRDE